MENFLNVATEKHNPFSKEVRQIGARGVGTEEMSVLVRAIALNVISSVLYVSGNIFSIYALAEVPLIQLLTLRWLFLGISTLSVAKCRGEIKEFPALGRSGQRKALLVMTILRCSDSVLWLSGLMFISLVEANALIYSNVMIASVIAHFWLGGVERISWIKGAFLLLGTAGVVLIVRPWNIETEGMSVARHLAGVACELGTALAFAGFQLFSRKRADIPSSTVVSSLTIYSMLLSMLVMHILAFSGVSGPLWATRVSSKAMLFAMGYAISTALGQFFQMLSFRMGDVITMGVVGYLEPVLSVFAQLFILNQPILIETGIGCGLVILAGLAASLVTSKPRVVPGTSELVPNEPSLELSSQSNASFMEA